MFSGSIPALVTPFRDGALDEAAFRRLRRLADRQAAPARWCPCGTTGEAPTMDNDEHHRVDRALRRAGRRPRAGDRRLRLQRHQDGAVGTCRCAKDLGADAALMVAPYYNRPSQDGLLRALLATSTRQCDLPIVLYNVPGADGDRHAARDGGRAGSPAIPNGSSASRTPAATCSAWSSIRLRCGERFCQLSGDDPLALGGYRPRPGRAASRSPPTSRPSSAPTSTPPALAGDFAGRASSTTGCSRCTRRCSPTPARRRPSTRSAACTTG